MMIYMCFFLMIRRPPRSTRTDTLVPYSTLFRSNLQSITAYREAKSGDTLDIDSLPINLVSFIAHTRQKQFSEELQLSGKSGRLEWIGGLYYFIEKGYEEADAKSFSILDPNAKVFRNTSGDASRDRKSTRLTSSH